MPVYFDASALVKRVVEEDGSDGAAALWPLDNPHPETTFGTIFRETWYEGYPAPAHTWQSSSGTDDFEPKIGLMPLIFGTLKATTYAMLFSVPIALLAAIRVLLET